MGTVTGLGVVALSPGNTIRLEVGRAEGLHGMGVGEALYTAVYQTALLIGQTLTARFYAVAPVLIVGYVAGHGQRVRNRSAWILATFIGCFALITVSIFPLFLIGGTIGYRNFAVGTFILMVSCAIMGYLVACRK